MLEDVRFRVWVALASGCCVRSSRNNTAVLAIFNNDRSSLKQVNKMTAVGFEPTQLALVELESTPLDISGKVSS